MFLPAKAPGSSDIDLPEAPRGPGSGGKLMPSSLLRSSSLSSSYS